MLCLGTISLILDSFFGVMIVTQLVIVYGMSLVMSKITYLGYFNNTDSVYGWVRRCQMCRLLLDS